MFRKVVQFRTGIAFARISMRQKKWLRKMRKTGISSKRSVRTLKRRGFRKF